MKEIHTDSCLCWEGYWEPLSFSIFYLNIPWPQPPQISKSFFLPPHLGKQGFTLQSFAAYKLHLCFQEVAVVEPLDCLHRNITHSAHLPCIFPCLWKVMEIPSVIDFPLWVANCISERSSGVELKVKYLSLKCSEEKVICIQKKQILKYRYSKKCT